MTTTTPTPPERPDAGPAPRAPFRAGPRRVALSAAALTIPVLFLGGSVTSYGVGMAVPDWPTTFGVNMFLYYFWNDVFGVKLEHSHRLFGAAIGLATIVLAGWLLVFDRRRALKALGVLAVVAVGAQGVMGGLRVARISTTWAAAHGCFGQAFFGLMAALCVLTGRAWHDAGPRAADPARLRRATLGLLALVSAQVVVGAWFRHFRSVPALEAHLALGVVVWASSAALFVQIARRRDDLPGLWPSTRALGLGVTLQVALGIAALVLILPLGGNPRPPTLWRAMVRTAHQTNGALLLAATVALTLHAFRRLAPAVPLSSPAPSPTSARSESEPAAPTLMEVIA